MQTLLIPDAHVTVGEDLTRFDKCGKLVLEKKPPEIIIMGDFVSLDSLSDFDMNKRLLMEQRRYEEDIKAGRMALDRLLSPIQGHNQVMRIQQKKQYRPKIVYLEGNHEFRARRYVETHAELEGFMAVDRDLRLSDYSIDFIPYRSFYRNHETTFTHCPMNKANQPISGKYAVARALERYNGNIVFGHTHRWEYMEERRMDSGKNSTALACGCFFSETPHYADGAENNWWKGVTMLHHHDEGFDTEQISMNRLFQLY
jgi:UDP-2,3-diacylglucosamine pyrophosphatase LpxH